MISDTLQPPPFWPSGRLWLKLLLALICSPLFMAGGLLFVAAAFGGESAYWARLVSLGLVVGGPMLMGLMLSPSRRGLAAGFLAMIGMLVVWYVVSIVTYDTFYWLSDTLPLGIAAGTVIAIVELVTQDVRERRGMAGLGLVQPGRSSSLVLQTFGVSKTPKVWPINRRRISADVY